MYYIHVSPADGLYSISELQSFMFDLVPLQATETSSFRMISANEMEFGRLAYDEVVGYSHEQHWKSIEIVSDDVLIPEDFEQTVQMMDTGVVTSELQRRTTVYVYPDLGYMYDTEGKLTFINRAKNIRPLAERTLSSRREDELVDSIWIP